MKDLLDELRAEHVVILAKVDELERILSGSEEPDVSDFVSFVHTYVEDRHHAKEEEQLYPRMRDDPFLAEIVDTLFEEHNEARRLIGQIASGGDARSLLATYAQNIRWHIAKEDTMIFQSAEASLTR